jgi:hypothetical protein
MNTEEQNYYDECWQQGYRAAKEGKPMDATDKLGLWRTAWVAGWRTAHEN